MSEKSKGDTSRIVKNPLLSASVTGLTFDDFTHNALLLPAAPPIVKPIQEELHFAKEPQPTVTVGKKLDIDTTTFSEINLNSSVDEDLPLPQVSNLDNPLESTTDESLLYQAASSFVQLPAVASTVFSTFSKVLKDYTPTSGQSREASEDKETVKSEYQSEPLIPEPYPALPVQPQQSPRPVTPPTFYSPTDITPSSSIPPPTVVSQNTYRLSSKKKTYAQVPGLSSHIVTSNHPPTAFPPGTNSQTNQYTPPSTYSQQVSPYDNQPPQSSSLVENKKKQPEERSGGLFSLTNFVSPVLQNLTGFGKSSPSEELKHQHPYPENVNAQSFEQPNQTNYPPNADYGTPPGHQQQNLQQPLLFNPSSYSTLVSQTQEKSNQHYHQLPPNVPVTDLQTHEKQSNESLVLNPPQVTPPAPVSSLQEEPQKVPSFFNPSVVHPDYLVPQERSIQSLFDSKFSGPFPKVGTLQYQSQLQQSQSLFAPPPSQGATKLNQDLKTTEAESVRVQTQNNIFSSYTQPLLTTPQENITGTEHHQERSTPGEPPSSTPSGNLFQGVPTFSTNTSVFQQFPPPPTPLAQQQNIGQTSIFTPLVDPPSVGSPGLVQQPERQQQTFGQTTLFTPSVNTPQVASPGLVQQPERQQHTFGQTSIFTPSVNTPRVASPGLVQQPERQQHTFGQTSIFTPSGNTPPVASPGLVQHPERQQQTFGQASLFTPSGNTPQVASPGLVQQPERQQHTFGQTSIFTPSVNTPPVAGATQQPERPPSSDSSHQIQGPPKLGPPGQASVSNYRLQKGTRHYKSALATPLAPFANFQPSQNTSPPPPPLNTPVAPLQQIYFPAPPGAHSTLLQEQTLVQEATKYFEPTAPSLSELAKPPTTEKPPVQEQQLSGAFDASKVLPPLPEPSQPPTFGPTGTSKVLQPAHGVSVYSSDIGFIDSTKTKFSTPFPPRLPTEQNFLQEALFNTTSEAGLEPSSAPKVTGPPPKTGFQLSKKASAELLKNHAAPVHQQQQLQGIPFFFNPTENTHPFPPVGEVPFFPPAPFGQQKQVTDQSLFGNQSQSETVASQTIEAHSQLQPETLQLPPVQSSVTQKVEESDPAQEQSLRGRASSEIIDKEVQLLTSFDQNSDTPREPAVVREGANVIKQVERLSNYENIVIHQDQIKTTAEIVEQLETVPDRVQEEHRVPYQLLEPDEHHLVRKASADIVDTQETSKFYLFKPIDRPEEPHQALETIFPQDSHITKDLEHIPTLKYVPSEPKLKSIPSEFDFTSQQEPEPQAQVISTDEPSNTRPLFSITNYFADQAEAESVNNNAFPAQEVQAESILNNNYQPKTFSITSQTSNSNNLNSNESFQQSSALPSFFSSQQISQCTTNKQPQEISANNNLPGKDQPEQDPLDFFNSFSQQSYQNLDNKQLQSDNNSILSEDYNNQSIQNFFNNPPQNLNTSTNDLNYNLIGGGVVPTNLQNLRVVGIRESRQTSSPLSTLVEPPSSVCSELSSEVSSQFGGTSFYKPNDTNDSEIIDPEILELFDMSEIKENAMNANTNVAYRPVTRHWFYKKVTDNKQIWTPFSFCDSNSIEENYSEEGGQNIVPVEGGRYDVNISERTRIPVYWAGTDTEVRRCSWFHKSDSRYVPYEETVSEILEEEYKNAAITGEWRRKIPLPTGETVVFHGPTVIVHYIQSQSADSWSSSSQTTARPRAVRRDIDDFNIDEGECKKVDHVLFMVHGIGSACDLKFRKVEEVVDEFRSIATQLVQGHYKNSRESGDIGRVEVLPVSWHSELHSEESGIDKKLRAITLESIPKLRNFANDTLLDVLFYTSPVFCQSIMDTVAGTMNKVYVKYCQRNPDFKGGVSLAGHSLGSLILFDLLCHQKLIDDTNMQSSENADDTIKPMEFCTETVADANMTTAKQISYTMGPAGTGQPYINYPHLMFAPEKFFALGSPIGMFVTIRGIDALGLEFKLPTCPGFYNIFHPYDPVAYRIEALVNPDLSSLRPVLIPHHKGRKRMHLELKETMTRVGADIKQKIFDTFRSTFDRLTVKHKTDPKEIEQEVDKVLDMQLKLDTDSTSSDRPRINSLSANSDIDSVETDLPLGELNNLRRIDYVLQEAPLEFFNEYLFALKSHVCYWDSEDTILFIMKEIYSSLGFRPDNQVPQQNMTIERPSSSASSTQTSPTKGASGS